MYEVLIRMSHRCCVSGVCDHVRGVCLSLTIHQVTWQLVLPVVCQVVSGLLHGCCCYRCCYWCCCCVQVELKVTAVHVVSRAAGALPFELVDAARSEVGGCRVMQEGNKHGHSRWSVGVYIYVCLTRLVVALTRSAECPTPASHLVSLCVAHLAPCPRPASLPVPG